MAIIMGIAVAIIMIGGGGNLPCESHRRRSCAQRAQHGLYSSKVLLWLLELAQGKVVGECYQRHRHQEFLSFLRRLDQEFPGRVPLHLVMDNYGTHKKEEVQAWLKKHPRFILHFVPTSSSWLNLVERWFSELSRQCIRRGAFFSVGDLKKAIQEFLAAWNEDPEPFVWTATVESIMENCLAADKPWRRFSPAAPCQRAERTNNELSTYIADTTLALFLRAPGQSKRTVSGFGGHLLVWGQGGVPDCRFWRSGGKSLPQFIAIR